MKARGRQILNMVSRSREHYLCQMPGRGLQKWSENLEKGVVLNKKKKGFVLNKPLIVSNKPNCALK